MATSPVAYPGDDITADLIVPPAWTAMAGSYTNSWSDEGSGNVTGQYRLWELLNSVEVIGNIAHGSISGNSAFFTLPAGYVPASQQDGQLWVDSGNHTGAIGVAATGVMTLFNLSSTTQVNFHFWIPLDA